ncbi:unnamed protein product [Ixodes pacificus]
MDTSSLNQSHFLIRPFCTRYTLYKIVMVVFFTVNRRHNSQQVRTFFYVCDLNTATGTHIC